MSGSDQLARWAPPRGFGPAVVVAGLAVLAAVVAGQLTGQAAASVERLDFMPVASVTFTVTGALVVPRVPQNPFGWLLLAVGAGSGAAWLGASWSAWWVGLWTYTWGSALAYGLLPVVLMLFPDGRPVGPGWRWAVRFAAVAAASAVVGSAVAAWQTPTLLATPAGLPADPTAALIVARAGLLAGLLALLVAAASLAVRWRRSVGVERRQLTWLALGAATIPPGLAAQMLHIPGAWAVPALTVPAAMAVAILKHHLYDVDLFLNRSIVYASLSVLLVGGYVAVVATLGALLDAGEGWHGVVAAGGVAVAFGPLRERIQRGANRLLYGDRDDPWAAVSRLARRLEGSLDPATVLAQVAATVAEALQLPYAAIELADGERTAAGHGRRVGEPEEFEMTYQGDVVGRLLVSPRSAAQPFTEAERTLVQDLARHAGAAARTVGLTADLQRSRERLVRSREEERRRLRRDLHDGLGPALAGMTLQVGVARALVHGEADRVEGLLGELEHQLQSCIRDIRQLVDDLHPTQLDRLGLVRAVRARAATFEARSTPAIDVTAPEDLPELPAAVEVAAYRIATEALTNVVRHARARRASVDLRLADGLVVEITDDGSGLAADRRAGVGLASMRERTAELGGNLSITAPPGGGTRVRAVLPLVSGS